MHCSPDPFVPSEGSADPFAPTEGGTDPFAPTEGSAEVAPGLDLFAMMPAETSVAAVMPNVAPTPVPTTPSLDLFCDLFDSMPDQSSTVAPKAEATPSLDLFAAAVPATSRGPSPLPDANLTADLLSDAFSTPAAPLAAAASPAKVDAGGMLDLFGDSFGGSGGELLMPAVTPQGPSSPGKAIGGDLDSSLANLVGNLGMGNQNKDMQWNEKKMTGGASWQPQPAGGAGAPMMFSQPMRPQFPAGGAPGAPGASVSPAAQSPRKPPPTKDPLADLNIKDFL